MEDCHTDSELLTQFHKNTPQLRFSAFDDEWEEKKLNNYLEVSTEKNFDNFFTKEKVLSVSGEFGVVNQIAFQGRSFAGASLTNYKISDLESVIYTKSPLNATPYGIIKANKFEKGIVSVLYAVYKTNNSDSKFIQDYFNLDERLNNYLRPLISKGAKNTINVSDLEALEGIVTFPSLSEQQKIGTFLSHVDSLIQAKTQKLESLKAVKKSLLQKCFPKAGEKVPEMRFAGFSGEWEEKTIGEIAEIITGGTPSTSHEDYWFPKEIPWLSSGEVNKKYILFTDDYISKKGFSNSSAHWIKSNSVLIALAGQGKTRGTVAINLIPITTNQSIAGIILNNEMDTNFVFQSLERKYEAIRKMSSGDGSRGGLNKQLVSEITFMCPLTLNEQQKIGQFFAKYDSLISLQKKEIENLKTIKKSLLQKMFV